MLVKRLWAVTFTYFVNKSLRSFAILLLCVWNFTLGEPQSEFLLPLPALSFPQSFVQNSAWLARMRCPSIYFMFCHWTQFSFWNMCFIKPLPSSGPFVTWFFNKFKGCQGTEWEQRTTVQSKNLKDLATQGNAAPQRDLYKHQTFYVT